MACARRVGRDDVAGGLLDSGGDVRVRLGGQPQVVGGVPQRRMTHIRLQDRQQRADVLALSEPEAEIVDREGVPQVVNAGTAPRPPWEMRACQRNRRKFLSMFPTVSGSPFRPGKNQFRPGRPRSWAW